MSALTREQRLKYMLEGAQTAERLFGHMARERLLDNKQTYLAATYAVHIVASDLLTADAETRSMLPALRWRDIHEMRRELVSGYRTLSPAVIFDTINDDFPPLIAELERILNERPNDGA